ncbi:hypothetical protein LLEC1_04893 [Akanthomyces lecanii]|uniref:Uncharacterized protein n=1 Tax=Cordyceps confragosa TaxID=2714763 RepID=A0A179IIL0_CORDF|nr:hypothetical protein LLEC1_04893 [Akanthomyces lecanii]
MASWPRNTNGDGGGRRGWRCGGESNHGEPKKPCTFFQRTQTCRYGSSCRFSHDISSVASDDPRGRNRNFAAKETTEQLQARADYHSWKRVIKQWPSQTDAHSSERLWHGALEILNGSERDWKHNLAKDLDDEAFHGRRYIQVTITCAKEAGYNASGFRAMSYFLQTMTHASILDCLSIDTCVGGLYNYFSGPNGNRAIPALQVFCDELFEEISDTKNGFYLNAESAAAALSTALRELLKREQRARLHDDLLPLIDSLEGLAKLLTRHGLLNTSALLLHHVGEMRAVVARARGLLRDTDADVIDFADAPPPAYPRGLHMPNDRHDNDKTDIVAMKIFPTRAEIFSDVAEFLPSTCPEQPHFLTDKCERHIDTLFRLLRQDTFGELKAVLSSTLRVSEIDQIYLDSPKLSFGNLGANRYPKALISFINCTGRRGLEVDVSFSQPPALRGKSISERRRWWEDSRRLAEGVLVSFMAIQDGRAQHLFLIISNRGINDDKDGSLTKHSSRATVTSRLTSYDQDNIETLLGLSSSRAQGVLVEFPGAIPATFVPILENLQNMQRLGSMPFQSWILPDRVEQGRGDAAANIPPPRYARRPGFAFSLNPILKNGSLEAANFSVDPGSVSDSEDLLGRMEAETDLDRGQCRALIAALSREFALIQGPPGTGKSYLGIELMKVLLNCQAKAALGPIVVVCYTNHALDQFLEHVLHEGTKKIIRIGGQSHSHLLQGHNLRTVAQLESKSVWERYSLAKSYEELDKKTESTKKTLGKAHGVVRQMKWENIQKYLLRHCPDIFDQFKREDAEGFKTVGRHPFDIWVSFNKDLANGTGIEAEVDHDAVLLKASRDVHSLSPLERGYLVKFWTTEIYKQSVDDLHENIKLITSTQREVSNIHDEVDRRVLQGADVIGITTTGLAKRISTLQRLRCKVVICEEAGEVMEPHMLSALLPTVEHIIQIGDHEQLRPQINNYGLSLESKQGKLYQLDRSQFERLSVGIPGRPKIPVAQLDIQRRMRPQISALIRETLYPNIQDHPSTRGLPDVVGMRRNVFWLDHDHLEDGACSEMQHKSHSNAWEASMVHALVRHIVRQGVYSSSDIAVLTPYTGQLQKLRAAMRSDFEIVLSDRDQDALDKDGFDAAALDPDDNPPASAPTQRKGTLAKKKLSELLRVATVDNFQGEEAKVVIISLVRSNEARNVGFLKTTNRINVLLSRAQHGMYLIGNSETYSNVQMWQAVIGLLRGSASVGNTLELCCPRHQATPLKVSEPDDFPRLSPEGGCSQACAWRLPDCGHMCLARCHSESMHNIFSCPQPCQRLHEPCGHGCQKPTCGEDCGRCFMPLKDIELPCGHIKDVVACHAAQKPETIRCQVIVEKTVPGCNHTVEVACFQSVNASYPCPVPCTTPLACGHICPGTCGGCSEQRSDAAAEPSHERCRNICMRPFGTCNHHCRRKCHDGTDCGLCVAPCEVRCQHSKCAAACSEGCVPCVEKCEWACEHQGACPMPCAAACTRLPCDERCAELLPCGHRCPSLCGEACPEDLCKECGMAHDARVDLLEMKTYAEIDVDLTPIVVLGCGHFFTAETLDGLVGMNTAYVADREGRFTALADVSGAFAKMPQCPDCQRPVRQHATRRYNRIINRAVADESARRFLVAGKNELMALDGELNEFEAELAASHADVLQSIKNIPKGRPGRLEPQFENRYKNGQELCRKMNSFCKRSSDRFQPSHKLYEATIHALRRRESDNLGEMVAGLTLDSSPHLAERDRRVALAGKMALMKLEFLTLEDMLGLLQAIKLVTLAEPPKWPGGSPLIRVEPFLNSCASFISSCHDEVLPKLAVEATLYHARMARLYQSCSALDDADKAKATGFVEDAKTNLDKATLLCEQSFQHADKLREAVQDTIRLLQREWYEPVSPEELAAIKEAMVTGPSGLATHSGHWYTCVNEHPFAIGECGMPMEQARCPECGAAIGGLDHQSVPGVTRAEHMEN